RMRPGHSPVFLQPFARGAHALSTTRPANAMWAVCFGVSVLDTKVDDMANVFMSLLNTNGSNLTALGPMCSTLRPGAGAPNLPQKEPSHVRIPSVSKPGTGLLQRRVRPSSRPSTAGPHGSGALRVTASVVTCVVQNKVFDTTSKAWRISYETRLTRPPGRPPMSWKRSTACPG